ncbi:MAG TPA: glycosyltransferase family 2 protein [Rhizomicrobium sp.]|nr:glycosyltransferase family 2 protein [Rhizomicrobium sp.]
MKVFCLLPVRNGGEDLSFYFQSAKEFADGIIALDDGSTDDTRSRLEAEPLVKEILSNPRRETYKGWDDSLNRRRLLAAAGTYQPDWVFWLDADEVVEPSDAAALRPFLKGEAELRTAYGVEVHRMIEGMTHYDRAHMWVTRFYSFSPPLTLSNDKLHFDLAPLEYKSMVKTSIRILHRASLTGARRQARFSKYLECDPENRWLSSYKHLVDEPEGLTRVAPRPPHAPIILENGHQVGGSK